MEQEKVTLRLTITLETSRGEQQTDHFEITGYSIQLSWLLHQLAMQQLSTTTSRLASLATLLNSQHPEIWGD